MGARFAQRAVEAKEVEDTLRGEGRHMEADRIKRLRLSGSGIQGTLKTLHRDNMELRKRLGLPSFLDEKHGGRIAD